MERKKPLDFDVILELQLGTALHYVGGYELPTVCVIQFCDIIGHDRDMHSVECHSSCQFCRQSWPHM